MRRITQALGFAAILLFDCVPALAQGIDDEIGDISRYVGGTLVNSKIVMATGSSQYFEIAESFRPVLERMGIQYEVQRQTEGFGTLKALLEAGGGINAGFIKGGLVGSMQGRLASEKAKGRHSEFTRLWSVGRLFYEPIWVFTRADLPISSLRDLTGRRILAGTVQSGTRRIAIQLLKANGIDKANATLLSESLQQDAASLVEGRADAAFLIEPPDSDTIQRLLRVENIRLMDFSAEAEAYDSRFPALTKVVLRKGAVEFNPIIPSDDITLLSTSVALVVRSDMHPALVSALTYAVVRNPKRGQDAAGDPILFYRAGEFPSLSDPEFEVPAESQTVYKTGELPATLRIPSAILQFPVAAFISVHWVRLLLLLPVAALVVPLFRALPRLYMWHLRRRLLYWYLQLKELDSSLSREGSVGDPTTKRRQIDLIEAGIRRVRLPLDLADHLEDLRDYVQFIRQKLEVDAPRSVQTAAE